MEICRFFAGSQLRSGLCCMGCIILANYLRNQNTRVHPVDITALTCMHKASPLKKIRRFATIWALGRVDTVTKTVIVCLEMSGLQRQTRWTL